MRKTLIVSLGLAACLSFVGAALAAEKSVTGTLEDSFCYITLGAHGSDHKQCAIKCAKKGIPVALVEKGSDNIYVLLPATNDTALPDNVISRMEDQVTVTGDAYSKGGVNYLTVKSVK
jgi:hypothetical protein